MRVITENILNGGGGSESLRPPAVVFIVWFTNQSPTTLAIIVMSQHVTAVT